MWTVEDVLLAIETTGAVTSVALFVEGALEGERAVRAERSHGREILPLVQGLLPALGGVRPSRVAASAGPGSFTGIRVGMGTALGLAKGWGARAVAVPTFSAWAEEAECGEDGVLVAVRSAGRDAAFAQVFVGSPAGPVPSGPPEREALDALLRRMQGRRTVWSGPGWPELDAAVGDVGEWRRTVPTAARSVGRWALLHGEDGDDVGFDPIYVRPPQAERARER